MTHTPAHAPTQLLTFHHLPRRLQHIRREAHRACQRKAVVAPLAAPRPPLVDLTVCSGDDTGTGLKFLRRGRDRHPDPKN